MFDNTNKNLKILTKAIAPLSLHFVNIFVSVTISCRSDYKNKTARPILVYTKLIYF